MKVKAKQLKIDAFKWDVTDATFKEIEKWASKDRTISRHSNWIRIQTPGNQIIVNEGDYVFLLPFIDDGKPSDTLHVWPANIFTTIFEV